ncbi:MAG: hypothetical protein MJA83_01125, partial [Gammaproteobacteria bacterium]|nr:hypothetical protein [Gammaproteobacteria bacterium]
MGGDGDDVAYYYRDGYKARPLDFRINNDTGELFSYRIEASFLDDWTDFIYDVETIVLGKFADSVIIERALPANLLLTFNGRAEELVTKDIIDGTQAAAGLDIKIDVDGKGYIRNHGSTEGSIELVDFDATILGSAQADTLELARTAVGQPSGDLRGFNIIVGGDGVDSLIGGGGSDVLVGGVLANDVPQAISGVIVAEQDGDADRLAGGAGDDVIVAHAGDTVASGEAGDRLYIGAYNVKSPELWRLSGGEKVGWAERPDDPQFPDTPHIGKGGETYKVLNGSLEITLPGEADPITIEDWEPGDYGIQLRNYVNSLSSPPKLDVDLSLLGVGTPVAPGGAGFALLATVFAQLAAHDPWANFRLPDGTLVTGWYYPDDLPWFDSDGDGQPDFDGLDNTRNGTAGDDEMGGTSG